MQRSVSSKIQEYFAQCDEKTLPKGTILIHAGEDPTGIFLLEAGAVEQYDITPDGNKVTVNMFKPAAYFPMSWAMNKTPNSYFFEAATEIRVRRANTEQTLEFMRQHPDVLYDLLSRVYKGTDALLRRHVITASGLALTRLMYGLVIEAYRFGTVTDDGSYSVRLSQNALAARCGLARETVNRELQKLEADGSVRRDGKVLTIDVQAIERLLENI